VSIDGTWDPRFAGVRDAFAANFAERDETGAAVCVSVDGRVVADLWGGRSADGRRWGPDTLVNVFSVGKAMVALLMAQLAGEGRVDVDAAVADLWPAFAAGGKEGVTVRQLLSHQAGLPAVRAPLDPDAIFEPGAMAAALAAEEPWWPPGTAHGYHVNTFGFLVGALLASLTGRSAGTLLRERVAGPLGADVHLGVPAADQPRVADFEFPADAFPALPPGAPPLEGLSLMRYHAYLNPPGISGAGIINTTRWRAAEMPSTNTHASARGVARVFTALAAGGAVDGVTVVDRAALAEAATEQVSGHDVVLDRTSRFGLGFQLTQPERPLGPGPAAFGHFGAGGSLGFCDPEAGVGFGYAMGRLGNRWQNPRNRALVDAVYDALA
jgi:CubicO group peptidase (beta-lactamase class C family)